MRRRSLAFQAADAKRKVGASRWRIFLYRLDVAFGVTVDDRQSLGGGMLGHEFAVLPPEGFAKTDRGVATEIRQSVSFLFGHVVVVGRLGAVDGRPPLVRADLGRVGVANPVANV